MPKEEPISFMDTDCQYAEVKNSYLPFPQPTLAYSCHVYLILSCILFIFSSVVDLVCEITHMQQSPAFPVQPVNVNNTPVYLSALKGEADTSDVAPETLRSETRTNRERARGAESVSQIAL